jgi:hypothetical protein
MKAFVSLSGAAIYKKYIYIAKKKKKNEKWGQN